MKKFVYGCIGVLFAIIVFLIIYSLFKSYLLSFGHTIYLVSLILIPLVFGIIGAFLAPHVFRLIEDITEKTLNVLSRLSLIELGAGLFGLLAGLLVGALLGSVVSDITIIGPYLSLIISIFCGYLGIVLVYKKRDDFSYLMRSIIRGQKNSPKEKINNSIKKKVLDTSVIIDGRIADIYKTGFIEGELVIPNFVLEELRHIADSADPLKRNRGRRGLDIMNKLRQDFEGSIKISDVDYADIQEVDSKLLKLAQDLKGSVLTNDFNLNKIAQLQEVQVLNINELSNAVKPMLIPGEEMIVQIVKDGKEIGQGVAYLDDGTMIVVENGKYYINKTIEVVVTSVLQTAAGRMIFARPKSMKNGDDESEQSGK